MIRTLIQSAFISFRVCTSTHFSCCSNMVRLEMLTGKMKHLSTTSRSGSESDYSGESEYESAASRSEGESTGSKDEPKDPRDRIVVKPEDSESQYRVLKLKNGLQCLLISDADETKSENAAYRAHELSSTDTAAACLTVCVGSAQDPRHIPGLAHLLEHMLFMGCKKYPNENEYDEYLDKHGGTSNASTDNELTSYVFDVSVEFLEGALDRFAHQFVAPLLKKSSVNREVKAVDSEYMEGLQSDTEKIDAICTSIIQPDHPFNMFSAGNRQTLLVEPRKHSVDILGELRKFYDQYYSAHIMCLCISSTHPLKKLEKMVKVFEKIPSQKILVPTLEKFPLPQPRSNFIKYCPVKDRKKLILLWFLTPQTQHFRCKPLEYVEWCTGHEGRGSLLSALKREGYATDLLCESAIGGADSSSNFTRFYLEIELSDLGLEKYSEVIKLVFHYIQMLREELPCERIFNEIKTMRDIDFENMESEEPYDRVESLAENMTLYPPEHYLNGPEQVFDYEPHLITNLLNALTPDRMLAVLQSKTFKNVCKRKEKWYKGMHCEGNFEPDFIEMLSHVSAGDFKLPEPNPYIPEDFEIKEIDVEGPSQVPIVIADKPDHKIWFHRDDVFEEPECMIYWHLFSKRVCEDIRSYALNTLYTELYCSRVSETFYSAGLAGLSSTVEVDREGFLFTCDGYSDKMFEFFKASLDEFFNSSENTFNFTAVKDTFVKKLRSSTQKPKKQVDELRQMHLRKTYITREELAEAVEQITVQDIKDHKVSSMGGFYLEVLCGGNITSEELHDYTDYFSNKINLDQDPLQKQEFRQERVYKFPLGRYIYKTHNKNPEDVNTAVVNYYQHDIVSFRDTVILTVLESLMSEPFFNQLRTRLQMGYSVSVDNHESFGVTGFSLSVHTQANKFSAKEANIYIETFLSWFTQYLNTMDDEDFESRVSEIIKAQLSPYLSIDDEFDQMWNEIVVQEYIFDRDQRSAEIMKQLTRGEVVSFYHNLFFRNVRKLSIQVEGNPRGVAFDDEKEGDDSDEESGEKCSRKSENRIANMTKLSKNAIANWSEETRTVQSIDEFHEECKLLPVYKMVTKVVTVDVTNKV